MDWWQACVHVARTGYRCGILTTSAVYRVWVPVSLCMVSVYCLLYSVGAAAPARSRNTVFGRARWKSYIVWPMAVCDERRAPTGSRVSALARGVAEMREKRSRESRVVSRETQARSRSPRPPERHATAHGPRAYDVGSGGVATGAV